jgi:HNH endonuclease
VPPCSFVGRQAQTAVHLRKNGVGFSRMVHRLVALAFIENPENKPEVNHKEAPKTNNAANNLEWATRAENDEHKKVHGWTTPGTKNAQAKLTEAQVIEIRNLRKQGWSEDELAAQYGVTSSNVSLIVLRKSWRPRTDSTT